MNVRRIPRAAPKRPASKTTLSRGEASPGSEGSDGGGLLVVRSSGATPNAAKSTSRASWRSRSSVVVPGWNEVVQGSTCATSSRPRVSACSSFCCFPDEPRKIRGLSIGLESISDRYRSRRLWLGDFGHRLGYVLWFVFQRQISLRDDADDLPIGIHDGYTPDLVLLHQPLATIQVLALAARRRIPADEFLNGRTSRVDSIGHYRTTEITIGNDTDQLT